MKEKLQRILSYSNFFVFFIICIYLFLNKNDIALHINEIKTYIQGLCILLLSVIIVPIFIAIFKMKEPAIHLLNINLVLITFIIMIEKKNILMGMLADPKNMILILSMIVPFIIYSTVKTIYLFFFNLLIANKKTRNNLLLYTDSLEEKTIKQTFFHELGHISVYCLIPKNIDYDIEMSVIQNKRFFSKYEYKGCVTAEFKTKIDFLQKPYVEFNMLLCLAGKVSEKIFTGQESMGAVIDYQSWLEYARLYLVAGHAGTYFLEANSQEKILINKISLQNLKGKQEKILEEFFEKNKDILIQFYEEYNDKEYINKKMILPLLDKLCLTNNIMLDK